MHKLKSELVDQLITAFEPEVKRMDAKQTVQSILEVLTKTVRRACPNTKGNQETIFEEEPDLVALLVQKGLKALFSDYKEMVLSLTDKVFDFNQ